MKKRVGSVLITVSAVLLLSSAAFAAAEDATVTETVEEVVEKIEKKVEKATEEATEKDVEKIVEKTNTAESTENTAESMSAEEVAKVKAETEALEAAAKVEAAKVEAEAAKAEAAKVKAEAAKVKAEAAKAEAAKVKAEAAKVEAEKKTVKSVAETIDLKAKESKKTAEDDDKEHHDDSKNAALAAGGVMSSGSGLPVSMTVSTGFSTDMGILLPGYKRQFGISPYLSLSPNFTFPQLVDWQPKMVLAASLSVFVNSLFNSYNSGTSPSQNSFNVSDFSTFLVFPALFKEKWLTGISLTPVLSLALPLSMSSRQQNRLASIAASVQASWNTATKKLLDPKYGVFGVQFRSRLGGPLYHQNSATYACGEAGEERTFLGVPVGQFEAADEKIGAPRAEERLGNGRCRAPGRQNALVFSNSLSVFYNLHSAWGGHTFTISSGLMNAYSRPLKVNSSVATSKYAVSNPFLSASEMTSGSISYIYALPIDLSVQLIAGLSSQQPLYNSEGSFYRFPFFDFSLGNGFTSANFTAVVNF